MNTRLNDAYRKRLVEAIKNGEAPRKAFNRLLKDQKEIEAYQTEVRIRVCDKTRKTKRRVR